MGQKSWLNNNEKIVLSYFCQQQKILTYINVFYTFRQDSNRHIDEARATKRQVMHQEKVISDTSKRLIEFENRSMRDNLVFAGISEVSNENTAWLLLVMLYRKNRN